MLQLPVAACLWDHLLSAGENALLRSSVRLLQWAASDEGLATVSKEIRDKGLGAAIKYRLKECTVDECVQVIAQSFEMVGAGDAEINNLKV